jgi:head-tail adaptor
MLPKQSSTGFRYLGSSAFNSYITILNPNAGAQTDGTPNAPVVVAQNIHANVSPWRSKEVDKSQTRIGESSFKIVIRFPKTYSLDAGMQVTLTRAGVTTLYEIESWYDPDGQGVEAHLWVWSTNPTNAGVEEQ